MSELAEYKSQLQQVEAALTVDPDNEDLLKLKQDLQEVINLTEDLEAKISPEADSYDSSEISNPLAPSSSSSSSAPAAAVYDEDEDAAFYRATMGTHLEGKPLDELAATSTQLTWNVGDKCLAQWSEDTQFYEATIDDILEDGSCAVTFSEYGNTDITKVSLLQPVIDTAALGSSNSSSNKPKTKKDIVNAQREYKKKKNEKKRARLKQLEEEREVEKNKWLSFNAKAFSKTNKGRVKKSIFATPDTVGGRVGVGTCGVSGKGMTKFNVHEKWKK